MLVRNSQNLVQGFTLIELMVVMAIAAVLITMVGPLAINTLEKAQAKQEMLTMKNWFRKISYRAFSTGQAYQLRLSGKTVELFRVTENKPSKNSTFILSKKLESLFFQPQTLYYNAKGLVSPTIVIGTYRNTPLIVDLKNWVNGEETNEK